MKSLSIASIYGIIFFSLLGKYQVGRLRTAEKIVNNITLLSSTAWFMILPAYRDRTVRNSYFEISWYSAPFSGKKYPLKPLAYMVVNDIK